MTVSANRVLAVVAMMVVSALTLLWGPKPVDPVNANRKGIAIHGFDPVAYFDESAAVKGSAEFKSEWMGARWRFASAENKAKFDADAARYGPQYGGYCAWAVSTGSTADIDPRAWTVRDGKLYLNYSKRVRSKWRREASERIAAADRHWPKLHR